MVHPFLHPQKTIPDRPYTQAGALYSPGALWADSGITLIPSITSNSNPDPSYIGVREDRGEAHGCNWDYSGNHSNMAGFCHRSRPGNYTWSFPPLPAISLIHLPFLGTRLLLPQKQCMCKKNNKVLYNVTRDCRDCCPMTWGEVPQPKVAKYYTGSAIV